MLRHSLGYMHMMLLSIYQSFISSSVSRVDKDTDIRIEVRRKFIFLLHGMWIRYQHILNRWVVPDQV